MIGSSLKAQIESGESLDKISAVVGNEIIMLSDIKARLIMMKQSNPSMNIETKEAKKEVLDMVINEKLILMKAIEDSVEANEEEIDARWNVLLRQLLAQFGSEKRIEDVYGMSISRMKFDYRDEIRKNIISQKLSQMKFGNIKCTPKEVEDFYERYKDSLETIPPTAEYYHIVKYVGADSNTKGNTYRLAMKIRDSLLTGGDFADFAERYSDDAMSAKEGGNLGITTRGMLIKEFEKTAFGLQVGEISLPVETPFGYHIIETLYKKNDTIRTRHILLKIGVTEQDKEIVVNALNEIKQRVEEGEDFEAIAKNESEDLQTKGFGGFIGRIPLSQTPQGLSSSVLELKAGEISEPELYNSGENRSAYHIIYKKRIIDSHEPNLKEDYESIQKLATMEKRQKSIQEYIDKLRAELYWEIKE